MLLYHGIYNCTINSIPLPPHFSHTYLFHFLMPYLTFLQPHLKIYYPATLQGHSSQNTSHSVQLHLTCSPTTLYVPSHLIISPTTVHPLPVHLTFSPATLYVPSNAPSLYYCMSHVLLPHFNRAVASDPASAFVQETHLAKTFSAGQSAHTSRNGGGGLTISQQLHSSFGKFILDHRPPVKMTTLFCSFGRLPWLPCT